MEQLLHWDAQLLLWINSHHTPFWDQVMWYASQSWTWIPLYLLMVFAIWKLTATLRPNSPEKTSNNLHIYKFTNLQIILLVFIAVACIGAAAGLSDYVTSGILKKLICRPRPTHSELAGYLHLVNGYTGGKYGFPSSHAANTFAVATCFLLILKNLRNRPHETAIRNLQALTAVRLLYGTMTILMVLYVAVNCYSRMYLGVHYPLDILTGGAIGLLFGWLFGRAYDYALRTVSDK